MKKGIQLVKKGNHFLLFMSIAVSCTVLYLTTWQQRTHIDVKTIHTEIEKYAVDTENCKIPKLDPFHPSAAHLSKPAKPLKCSLNRPPLVVQKPNRTVPSLLFLKDKKHHYGANVSCFYQAIHRVSEEVSVFNLTMHKIDKPIVLINDEFIKVNCVSTENGTQKIVFEDYFAFIQKKSQVENRVKELLKHQIRHPNEKLNVLLLLIDSVSNSHFHRLMINTNRYLHKYLSVVEMFGYNKIGTNTYPNILPLLTGFVDSEVNYTQDKLRDHLPLVWKDYSAAGYRTLLSEDNAGTAIFNYLQPGFGVQPTDYYWRPFKIAFQSKQFGAASSFGCIGNRSEAISILNWTLDFFYAFPTEPLFALTFLTYFSHDYLNTLSIYDEPFLQFLQQMNAKHHLNRTVMIFLSDHGFRNGEARQTYVGRMEDKLLFMFFIIPPWFKITYPSIMENLKQNANRLVTVLDLHAVLKDYANSTAANNSKSHVINQDHSINLFRTVVPGNRTCSKAKLQVQFCACISMQQITVSTPEIQNASTELLDKINEVTKSFRHSCKLFELVRIQNAASQAIPMNDPMDTNSSLYQISIQVTPGDVIFEGSVWYFADSKVYSVEPNIERVNRYGTQSSCITERAIKPFCFCR